MENAALLNAIVENAIDGIVTIGECGLIESGDAEARYKSEFKADQKSVTSLKEIVDLLLGKIEQVYQQLIKGKIAH